MASAEQIEYLEALLEPYYDLKTGEPLDEFPPYDRERDIYLTIMRAEANGVDLFV